MIRPPHPIPYQGSKRKLAGNILKYIPAAPITLIEPFAGSAAISLAIAQQYTETQLSINDINEPLINLWRAITETPQALAKQYKSLWYAQLGNENEFYYAVREKFNHTPEPHLFLFLLARCVKASVRYNANGEFNQSPDKRRKGTNPKTMESRILQAAHLLKGRVTYTSQDYQQLLATVPSDAVIYMDPPYQGVSYGKDPRYAGSIDTSTFINTLRHLIKQNTQFLVSYDGRSGEKTYGEPLPDDLGLTLIELDAGRSSQATLLGKDSKTIESLYVSPALMEQVVDSMPTHTQRQLSLW